MTSQMTMALAGNPNSGKTTMFNALTGARQRVGNYPGVTVEKREGSLKYEKTSLNVIDLPGTYSLTAYSPEELVARNYLVDEKPEIVMNIIDATNLERNLYLSVQFMELGIPMVLALNMMDEVKKQGKHIDIEKLSKIMNIPIVKTVARTGEGKGELIRAAIDHAAKKGGTWKALEISYGPDIDPALKEMTTLICDEDFLTDNFPARWTAVKYLEDDEQITTLVKNDSLISNKLEKIKAVLNQHLRKTLSVSAEAIIADYRYGYISSVIKKGVVNQRTQEDRVNFSDKLDSVLTHRILGPVIMLAAIYFIFYATFPIGEIPMGWLESFFEWLGDTATAILPPGHLQSLVVDGIIGGVGGVLGFVPLIMVMFLMITFLEDSGYMARMAYMMDRILRVFGLHGYSLMPFIVSGGIPGGCAVPGVMAARTLKSPKEKLATVLTAPFMSCGAKVPVFILLTAAFFTDYAPQAMFLTVLMGWGTALVVARILRSTVIRGESTPFVMELPPYRMPTLRGILIHTWERAWQYIKKAGTVILVISVIIWTAMKFPGLPAEQSVIFENEKSAITTQIETAATETEKEKLQTALIKIENDNVQAALKHSFAGKVGSLFEPVSKLAGFDWRTNIALLGGFAAKEVIVSSLGTAYSMGEVDAEESGGLSDRLRNDPSWNKFTAISLIIFVLLYAPCFVTVVVIAKETSWKWAFFSMIFNTVLAFSTATLVYQVGTRFFL